MTSRTPSIAPRRAIIEPAEPPVPPPADEADWLRALDWRAFEQLIADAYRRQGFSVLPTAHGADGGIDLILTRATERVFVQCKHWRSYQVGVSVVRELFGVVAAFKATGGIVATSGHFTPEAVEFARVSGIVLLDGPAVAMLTASGLPIPTQPTSVGSPGLTGQGDTNVAPVDSRAWPPPSASQRVVPPVGPAQRSTPARPLPGPGRAADSLATPWCPICTAPMVLRRARRGPAAGSRFWGCSRFPGCKGVRELSATAPVSTPNQARPAPKRTVKRFLNRLTYRIAQVATVLIAVGLACGVMYGVLMAIIQR